MIIATFSNGTTDLYKGDRDVKAAWALVRKADGVVIKSGHSLDRATALKTAEGKFREVLFHSHLGLHDHPLQYVEGPSYNDTAKIKRAKKAHNAERLAFVRTLVGIEIVDL